MGLRNNSKEYVRFMGKLFFKKVQFLNASNQLESWHYWNYESSALRAEPYILQREACVRFELDHVFHSKITFGRPLISFQNEQYLSIKISMGSQLDYMGASLELSTFDSIFYAKDTLEESKCHRYPTSRASFTADLLNTKVYKQKKAIFRNVPIFGKWLNYKIDLFDNATQDEWIELTNTFKSIYRSVADSNLKPDCHEVKYLPIASSENADFFESHIYTPKLHLKCITNLKLSLSETVLQMFGAFCLWIDFSVIGWCETILVYVVKLKHLLFQNFV